MDAFDFLGEQVVLTPVGRVAVSVAGHDDGSVSVVAWLLPAGRRVGYLSCWPRQRRAREVLVDSVLDGTMVRPLMETMLDDACGLRPANPAMASSLVDAGVMTNDQLADMLGWQWLLAEVGQPRRLGELAVQAGLVDWNADAVLDDAIERRDPTARSQRIPQPISAELVGSGL